MLGKATSASFWLIWTTTAAAAPGHFPLHGYLTTTDGTPIDGVVDVTFRLFPDETAATPFYADTLDVDVANGQFVVELGSGDVPLELTDFAEFTSAYLSLAVDGGDDMPAVPLGTVAYAAAAAHAADADRLDGHTWEDLTAVIPEADDIEARARGLCYDSVDELRTDLDGVFLASDTPIGGLTAQDLSGISALDESAAWDSVVDGGDHRAAGYLDNETDPVFQSSAAADLDDAGLDALTLARTAAADWDQAFGFGDHAQANYLLEETDPVFAASAARQLTDADVDALGTVDARSAAWDAAYEAGDHREVGYARRGSVMELSSPQDQALSFASGTENISVERSLPPTSPQGVCAVVFSIIHTLCPSSGACREQSANWTPVYRLAGTTDWSPVDPNWVRRVPRATESDTVVMLSPDETRATELGCQVSDVPVQPQPAVVSCRVAYLCQQ